jgi:NAD(P)H-dependent flavin oxidoreductase YrpB (nitropropane dioxygenase family)
MMTDNRMPNLRIGDVVASIPIIQGGMGVGISLSGLASAVANAGGIGVISGLGLGVAELDVRDNYKEANKRALRQEIRKARETTSGAIGVNIMVAATGFEDLIQGAVDEMAELVLLGAGLPLKLPETLPLDRLGGLHTKFAPIVSSGRAARLIFGSWEKRYNHVPDAVVVEGPLAGGHLGFSREQISNPDYVLERLLPDVISELAPFEARFDKTIPVIAAGGIYTGADIHKFLQMGARGVQMGTRFVATHECDASIEFKEAFVKCREEDIVIIDSPVGLPGRAIRNTFLDEVSAGIRKPFRCPWTCLRTCAVEKAPYCIANALTNAKRGNLEKGFAFAGANAYRVDKIVSVKELIDTLMDEYEGAASGRELLQLSG